MTSPPEAAPSAVRHWFALAFSALGTMLDVALIVIGSALLGLAAAVLLDGFELINLALDLSTGAMLGSSLVIGIVGGFALGVASEGPLGRRRRSYGFDEAYLLVARIIAAVIVGLLMLVVRGLVESFVSELPEPFEVAADVIRATGVAGLTAVPVIGVPLAWWIRTGGFGASLADDGDIPIMYVVWAITTMVVL
ncbi:MAG TPA: hypothetical protein VK088_00250 [Acidimicrobiia bacterium]|nr:hypothetical protein [Acidimicrobiia bacterium]